MTLPKGFELIEETALVMFNEWHYGVHPVDPETFCREFTRAVEVNTLKWAADYMRQSGPTIAAILLEESARDVDLALKRPVKVNIDSNIDPDNTWHGRDF